MSIENFRKEVEREKERIFPDTRIIISEELPFYLKMRLVLDGETFIEARINSGSRRESFVLVRKNKRIAGLDNLVNWHLHPCGKADTHRKIVRPSVGTAFRYLVECYRKQ